MSRLKSIIVIITLFGLIIAAPTSTTSDAEDDRKVRVLRQYNYNNGKGDFNYLYELDDEQIVSAAGTLKLVNNEPAQIIFGDYTWKAPNGITIWVKYVADENGYRPIMGFGTPGGIKSGQAPDLPNTLKSSLI